MGAIRYDKMRALVKRAAASGAKRRGPTVWEWDQSGNCQAPITRELWSRPPADLISIKRFQQELRDWQFEVHAAEQWGGYFSDEPKPRYKGSQYVSQKDGILLVLFLDVRCRQCVSCRRVRSRMWYARAVAETKAAARSWFVTLTLSPEKQFLALTKARKRIRTRGDEWELLTPAEQFRELHRANGQYLQLWLKRVRKESGARLRFLLVAEAHKSGLPHYHAIIHECVPKEDARKVVSRRKVFEGKNRNGPFQWERVETMSGWLTEEMLGRQWSEMGFSKSELIGHDTRRASYLCKYLNKSSDARVRASSRYGKSTISNHSENVKDAAGGADTNPRFLTGNSRGRSPEFPAACSPSKNSEVELGTGKEDVHALS